MTDNVRNPPEETAAATAGANDADAPAALTVAVISKIWNEMVKSGVAFRVDWEGLARGFLCPFFKSGSVYRASAAELRECYLAIPDAITQVHPRKRRRRVADSPDAARTDMCDIPQEPREFYRFIGQEILGLESPPSQTLADLYEQASADLRLIDEHVEECRRLIVENGGQLTRGSRSRGRSDRHDDDVGGDEKAAWVRLYNYYAEMNYEAREEIVRFVTRGIRAEALRASYKRLFPYLDFHVPYSFRFWPERYHPSHFSDARNKFKQEPIRLFHAWCRCYNNNRKAFFSRLRCYLRARAPIRAMRDGLDKHHRLNARREMLLAAFDAYDRAQWGVFATLAVVQIEGLFLGYCEDLGVSTSELALSSLPSKLQAILRETGHFPDYAYYAFRLPVIRNHLAHGRLLENDAEHTAQLLLLDLYDVFDYATNAALNVNALVGRLQASSRGPLHVADAIAVAFVDLPPPAFYSLDQVWNDLRGLAQSKEGAEFVLHLAGVAKEQDPEDKATLGALRAIAIRLMKASPRKEVWKNVVREMQAAYDSISSSEATEPASRAEFWRWLDAQRNGS